MIEKVQQLVAQGYGRGRIAKALGISEKKARTLIEKAKRPPTEGQHSKIETGDEIQVEIVSDRLYTKEEMAAFHKIDLNVWEAAYMKTNYWEMGAKVQNPDGTNTLASKPLHQLKITWRKKQLSTEEFDRRRDELEAAFLPKSYKPPMAGDFQNWIILPDLHVPFHNKNLLNSVLSYLNQNKVDGIILSGDFLDLKSLSAYDADKVQDFTLMDEYLAGREVILDIEAVLKPGCQKIFLCGNHEYRYYKELKKLSGSKLGSALLSPDSALKLTENGWKYLSNWQEDYILLGNNLEVIHGTITSQNASNAQLAKSSVNGRSVMFGHTHRLSFASSGKYSSWNIGTLADIDDVNAFGYVDRYIRQSWQNGFALVTIDKDGDHFVTPVKCSKDGFFLNGVKW